MKPRSSDRIITLDYIRGLAVLGILLANIMAFAQPFDAAAWAEAMDGGASDTDNLMWSLQLIFVDGKFRGLFTILFGAGLALFLERAWQKGESTSLQVRRLCALLAFGLIHYFFIWQGDILALYAFWGLAALPLMRMNREGQALIATLACVLGATISTIMTLTLYDQMQRLPKVDTGMQERILSDASKDVSIYTGSWSSITDNALANDGGRLVDLIFFAGITETFGLIILGVVCYRYGLFRGKMLKSILYTGWVSLLLGTIATAFLAAWVASNDYTFASSLLAKQGLAAFPHFAQVLGLVIVLAAHGPRLLRSLGGSRISAAGRMAFSNYIGTSIVMTAIFYGWGLDQFGRYDRLELMLFVLLGWALMLAWSKPWLTHFRHGPLEWAWRCITYGKILPMRRTREMNS